MELDSGFKARLNELYSTLTAKSQNLMKALMPLVHPGLLMSMSYVIKHYIRNMYKRRETTPENATSCSEDNYPIPVIRLSDLCEVETYTDVISVFTRLRRRDVESFDFSLLSGYGFEAYGYDSGQLIDFSDSGGELSGIKDNILKSNTEVADFYFDFPFDADENDISALVTLLHNSGFFF